MRVYLIEPSAKGGLIHYAFHLARGFSRINVDVTLVTSQHYELHDLDHPFEVNKFLNLWDPRGSKDVNPIWRKVRRGLRGIQYVYEWWRLVQFLDKERPDVILFGEMRFAFEVRFLNMLRQRGLYIADVVHDVESYDTRQGSNTILQQSESHQRQYYAIYDAFDALFVHDRTNREKFLKLYNINPNRVHEIPMATNELVLEVPPEYTADGLRAHLKLPTDVPIILFFGTITKYKGVEDLIHAMPQIATNSNAHLLIAGFPAKDVNAEELKTLTQELDIMDRVTWFLGYVPNEWVVPMMALSDMVVLPYRAITQSAVIQIAYACGVPVVATQVGGLPDIIEVGKSGILAEPNNPISLANAILELLDNPNLEQMGMYAQELANTRYSWHTVAQIMHQVFNSRSN